MSALIPYAQSELGAPTAMDLGIAIGKSLGAAAIKKGHAWATAPAKERPTKKASKAKKPRNMARVGERVGASNTKWDTLNVVYTNMSPQVLNQLQLLNVTKTAGSSAYDRRLMDQLNFTGIKFCMNFRTEGALGTSKAMMNVAVISPKAGIASDEAIPNAEFFRDPTGSDRAIDFGNAALRSLDYYCTPINTDKYNIHKRMKFLVGPTQSTEGNKEKLVEFYMPIKRQIRYETLNSFPTGKNLYLVWWFNTSDGGTPANSVRFSYRIQRYFKETVGL